MSDKKKKLFCMQFSDTPYVCLRYSHDFYRRYQITGDRNLVSLDISDEDIKKGGYYELQLIGDKNWINYLNDQVRHINHKIRLRGYYNQVRVGNGNDDIVVIGEVNHVEAGDGHNTLIAIGQRNRLKVQDGYSKVSVEGEYNHVEAGDGHNTLIAIGQNNWLKVKGGYGRISVKGYKNRIDCVSGYYHLVAKGDGNKVKSGSGKNIVTIAGNNNKIYGRGDDRVYVRGDNNMVYGYADNDIIRVIGNNNCIRGGGGNDLIYAAHGDSNILDGGIGDNTLIGGNGKDIFLIDPGVLSRQTLVNFNSTEDRLVIVWNQKNKNAHFPKIYRKESSYGTTARHAIQIGKTELVFTQDVLGRKIVFDVVDSQAMKTVRQTITDAVVYKVVSYVPTVPVGKDGLLPCYPLSQQYHFDINDNTVSHMAPLLVEDFEVNIKDEIRISLQTDKEGNIISQHPLTIGDFFVDQKSAVISFSPEIGDLPVSDVETIFLYCLKDKGLRFQPKGEQRVVDRRHGLTHDRWNNQLHTISVGDLNTQHVWPVGFSSVDSAQVRIAVGLKNGYVTPFSMKTTTISFVEKK